MASSFQGGGYETKGCPFCGKPVPVRLKQCPHCREAIPDVQVSERRSSPDAGRKIRRGLLYMILAGVILYFAGGYSPFTLPVQIPGFVSKYLVPLLFLGGLGLTGYGLVKRKS
jgi:hypothetical protein